MKVISFCIYGSSDKYCKGLDENLKLMESNLPDYNAFVYVGDGVPEHWIVKYQTYPFVKLIYTGRIGHDNMINRFYAIDETHVEIAVIRDADSRLHSRDIWCIRNWEQSEFKFHTIRDHPGHRALILGGLWGIKKDCINFKIQDLYTKFNSSNQTINKIQHDQYFLRDIVYPLVCLNTIIYVFNEKMRITSVEQICKIPLEVIDDNFCGLAIKYSESGEEIKEYKWTYGFECDRCGKFCGPTKCGKCGLAFYCSRECQVLSWSIHKLTCGIDNTQYEQIDKETILVKSQIYDGKLKKFIYTNKFDNIDTFIEDYLVKKTNYDKTFCTVLDTPTLVINTLHSCWTHAFIDSIFPYFWSYLYAKQKFSCEQINIFIRKGLILQYPNSNLSKITTEGKYKKNYQTLLDLIPHDKLIFEHLIEPNKVYLFNNCIHYILDDKWQRSFWNCVDYYFARNYLKSNIIYNDKIIKGRLDEFKAHILNKHQIKPYVKTDKTNIVILNKKKHPDNTAILLQIPYLDQIINLINLKQNVNFNGVKYFEDLDFKEQIQIIENNDIILSVHGGAMLHMIFGENKLYIEFFNNEKTNSMYKRVANISNNKLVQINVNFSERNIIDNIKNLF